MTTIAIYFRNIRAICNYSIANGYMKENMYPFKPVKKYSSGYIKIPKATKRKDRFLVVEDILKLWSYDTPEHKTTAYGTICESLNMWMFSYLANGMNLLDMALNSIFGVYCRRFRAVRASPQTSRGPPSPAEPDMPAIKRGAAENPILPTAPLCAVLRVTSSPSRPLRSRRAGSCCPAARGRPRR